VYRRRASRATERNVQGDDDAVSRVRARQNDDCGVGEESGVRDAQRGCGRLLQDRAVLHYNEQCEDGMSRR